MYKVEEAYREKLGEFQTLHKELSDYIWTVFPPADKATVDDMTELRRVVIKMKEARDIADGLFTVRKLVAFRAPMSG